MIILLNGTSSAGKTSIAKRLQMIAARPLLHVQMDAFLEMMPPRYANHAEAFEFVSSGTDDRPEITVRTGPYGAALMRGMRGAIAELATEGLNLVVDDVMLATDDLVDYRRRLAGHDMRLVGVLCDIDVAEQRERRRGDRMIGLVRGQVDRVHRSIDYDFVVDAGAMTIDAAADRIRDRFEL